MVTCWSLLRKYGNFKPFYLDDAAVPGTYKILLDFLDFLYFCHILLHADNCIFWHHFSSLSYFGISICHFHYYLFPIIFFILAHLSNLSHIFFPYFAISFRLSYMTTSQEVLSFRKIKKLK